jgi:DNA-binding CsgD family transcriptional regulator/PAS domain-containing protein
MGDFGRIREPDLVGDGLPHWPVLLQKLCTLVPGCCFVHRAEAGRAHVVYEAHVDRVLVERWERHLRRAEPTRATLRAGQLVRVSLPGGGGAAHAMAAPLRADEILVTLVQIRRTRHEPREVELMERLLPALRRAWTLDEQVAGLRRERDCARAALDLVPTVILTLDAGARVLHANQAGRRLLAGEGDGLRVDRERLAAARAHDTARLKQAVRAVAESAGPSVALSLAHPGTRRALLVTLQALPGEGRHVIAVLHDPEATAPFASDALAAMFGLSPAEARLAAALVAGRTVDDCAGDFGVSVHTIRSQLRRLFQKTQTRRQPELVSLLMSAVPRG